MRPVALVSAWVVLLGGPLWADDVPRRGATPAGVIVLDAGDRALVRAQRRGEPIPDALVALLDRQSGAIKEALRASTLPGPVCEPSVARPGQFLEHAGAARDTARLFALEAQRAREAGDLDAAARWVAAIFRLGVRAAAGPRLLDSFIADAIIEWGQRAAEPLLADARLNDAQRATVAAAVRACLGDDPMGYQAALRGQSAELRRLMESAPGEQSAAERLEMALVAVGEALPVELRGADAATVDAALARLERGGADLAACWAYPEGMAEAALAGCVLRAKAGEYGPLAASLLPEGLDRGRARLRQTVTELRRISR